MDDTFYSWPNDKPTMLHSVIAIALTTTAISKRDRLQFHRWAPDFPLPKQRFENISIMT